jgi:hypothetical protein
MRKRVSITGAFAAAGNGAGCPAFRPAASGQLRWPRADRSVAGVPGCVSQEPQRGRRVVPGYVDPGWPQHALFASKCT